MVPCDPGWSDVGAWDAIWDIAAKDAKEVTYHVERSGGPPDNLIEFLLHGKTLTPLNPEVLAKGR